MTQSLQTQEANSALGMTLQQLLMPTVQWTMAMQMPRPTPMVETPQPMAAMVEIPRRILQQTVAIPQQTAVILRPTPTTQEQPILRRKPMPMVVEHQTAEQVMTVPVMTPE
jgi:hypothetical protein